MLNELPVEIICYIHLVSIFACAFWLPPRFFAFPNIECFHSVSAVSFSYLYKFLKL